MKQKSAITLRPAEAADEDFLISLYRTTREAELAQVPWSAEQKDVFVRSQYAAQKQHYRHQHPAASHDVICAGDVGVGRLYLARGADAFHILDITVLPQHRGAGVGSFVLQQVMEEAGLSGKAVTIYVESFNPSLKLFRKLGFEPVAETGFHLLLRWMASGGTAP